MAPVDARYPSPASYPSPDARIAPPALDKALAGVEGAVEGLAEGLERHGFAPAAHRAIDAADRLAASTHLRRDTTRPSPVARRLHAATGRLDQTVRDVQETFQTTVEDTKRKMAAVQETGRRAARAPGLVTRDVAKAAGAYGRGLAAGIGLYAALGACGLFALVLLTMAGVTALTPVLGAAGALLVFGLLYVGAAGACLALAQAAQRRAAAEARLHLEEARNDLRHVAEPVQEAFAAGPAYRRARPVARIPAR